MGPEWENSPMQFDHLDEVLQQAAQAKEVAGASQRVLANRRSRRFSRHGWYAPSTSLIGKSRSISRAWRTETVTSVLEVQWPPHSVKPLAFGPGSSRAPLPDHRHAAGSMSGSHPT